MKQVTTFKFVLLLFIGQYVLSFVIAPVLFFVVAMLGDILRNMPFFVGLSFLFPVFLATFLTSMFLSHMYVLPQPALKLAYLVALVSGLIAFLMTLLVGLLGFGMGPSISPLTMLTSSFTWSIVCGLALVQGTATFLALQLSGYRKSVLGTESL